MPLSRFKIFFRQRQLQYLGNDVIVQCTAGQAEYVPGVISNPAWVEMTDFTDSEGLEKLSLNWSATGSSNSEGGSTTESGSNYDKGVSLDLRFYGDAYNFIYDWLLSTPCSVLNSVEVRIDDLLCGKTYRIFEIKADNLRYMPYDDPCVFEVKLRERDLTWHAINKTFIWDNWQDWFKDGSTKDHPCFLTCIEGRPRLLQSVRLGLLLFLRAFPVAGLIIAGEDDNKARRILELDNFVPSPLIRDIIANVCGKYGIAYDTMFDDVPGNEYKDLCLFYPSAGYAHENDDGGGSPNLWYLLDNRWNVTLAEFLDLLKPVFNAEWYVTPNNTLVFKPKTYFLGLAPIYDFTVPGALPFYELEYTFNGEKKPAYGRYQYIIDGVDLASHEIEPLYNDIVDYDGDIDNPMLEGNRSKSLQFAPAGFVRDGRKADYIDQCLNDARTIALVLTFALSITVAALLGGAFTVVAALILAGFVTAMIISITAIRDNWDNWFQDWETQYTGAIRTTAESHTAPKLILWDGVSMSMAKAVAQAAPAPNVYYNPTSVPYVNENEINSNGVVFNYPMYFDARFEENLFDRFHDAVDNPLKNPESFQDFRLYVDLCCDFLDILGVWDNEFIKIGYMMKLEERGGYEVFGRIAAIDVQYEENKIVLRGKVFKKPL